MQQDDWRELFLGRVDATLTGKVSDRHRPHRDYRARIPLGSAGFLVSAADQRNLSVSAYLRRAGMAFTAFDLGMSLADLLDDEPATRHKFDGPQSDAVPQLHAHGLWQIQNLGAIHE